MTIAGLRWGWCLALVSGLMAPLQAQPQALPPLPSLPQPAVDPELQSCVARFGHTGCAARLYAQLLCHAVPSSVWRSGSDTGLTEMEQQLAERYEQAAIDFKGITPEQVEIAAVRYYAPMLCPEKSPQIRQLFSAS